VIIAAILGGMGTIVGAAIGGMIVYLLPEYLSGIDYVVPVLGTPIAEIDFLLFSVIALLLLFVLPGGVLRWALARGRDLLGRARPGNDAVATDGGTGIEAGATPIAAIRERWTEVLMGRTPGTDRSRSGPALEPARDGRPERTDGDRDGGDERGDIDDEGSDEREGDHR
jgi:branched-chain amino acid transport system permease protein